MTVCKSHAYRLIDEEVTNSGTYVYPTQVPNMETSIIQSHCDFHQKHKISTSPPDNTDMSTTKHTDNPTPVSTNNTISTVFFPRLPALGFIIKMHKDNRFRYLSRGANSSLTQVSQWITRALKGLFPTSERLWIASLHKCAIHSNGSWIINDGSRVRTIMHRMNVERLNSQTQGTFDFSSMYTTLDLQELKDQMKSYVSLCFDHENKILKVHSRENHKWIDQHVSSNANSRCFDAATLVEWISFLVDNFYISVGDRVTL